MGAFGNSSLKQRDTMDSDIKLIFDEVVKRFDISLIEAHRTAERQHEHWQKGRVLKEILLDPKVRDNWEIVNKDNVVTYKDGYEKESRHQEYPAIAVDVVPYPSMWSDVEELDALAEVVYEVQDELFAEGRITKKIVRGYELWKFDRPHWQYKD